MVQDQAPAGKANEKPSTAGTLAIQLVDGFTEEGMAGVEVCFGAMIEVAPGEPSFRHSDEDYKVILALKTDTAGWVLFKNAHLWRSEACAVCIKAQGYRQGSTRDVLTGDVLLMRADDEVVATALLVPEDLQLGEGFRATVDAYLSSITRVRVLAQQGANYGDQSAVISLVQALRQAGYAGKIQVLCGADPLPGAPRDDVSVWDKLLTLRPDLTTATDLAGVEWIREDSFDEDASSDPAVLGIIPAGVDYTDATLERLKGEVLKTGCLLCLEPFHWFPDTRAMCLPGSKPTKLCLPRAASYPLSPARPLDAGERIEKLCTASGQSSLIAPLTALLELAWAKTLI